MKGLKISFIVLAAALVTFGLGGMALAFVVAWDNTVATAAIMVH